MDILGLQREGPLQRRIPNLGCGPVCTRMACWKRGHSLGTAQLKHCKCSSLIFNYISHWLITLYSETPFPQATLSVLRVSNSSCCAEVCIFPQILCFSLSDHFAWNFKCIPDLAFDLCKHSGGHTCIRAVLRPAHWWKLSLWLTDARDCV